jgi:hypothetical protein
LGRDGGFTIQIFDVNNGVLPQFFIRNGKILIHYLEKIWNLYFLKGPLVALGNIAMIE